MENNNSVCFVAKINEIKPINGADNIELGVIGGWNCIIKKGSHVVGELVVVATTDAVIPQELSDAMNVTNYLRKGGRVRTVKLKGVYSECLIIPFSYANISSKKQLTEGSDCMDILNVFKYEPPIKQVQLSSGKKIRYQDNPNFHVYYKFPNLKNVPGIFSESDVVQISRKIHGTNSRYGIVRKNKLSLWDKVKKFLWMADEWIDYEYVYGSHNVEKGSDSQGFYSTDVWREVANNYRIKEILWEFIKENYTPEEVGSGFTMYGEIFGPGIQKNYDYGMIQLGFNVFDISINGVYQPTFYVELVCDHSNSFSHVPVLYEGPWNQEEQDKWSFNNFIAGTKIPHEGIVIKAIDGSRAKIAKVINPDYTIWSEKHNVGDSH